MYKTLTAVLLGLLAAYCLINIASNGPFFDEGIYVTAGYRTLQGYGFSDRFLTWFAGSLVWPAMVGVAHSLAGIAGVRVLATLLSLGSAVFVYLSTKELYDDKAGFFACVCYVLAGPFLTLSHFGVYDVPALFWMSVAFYGIVMLYKHDHRVYLILVIIGIAMAAISKYPIAFMTPILLLMILALRPGRWRVDWGIMLFTLAAIGLFYFLPLREQLVNLIDFLANNRPTFGASRALVINAQFYYAVPMLTLAVLGMGIAPNRKLGLVLVCGILFWPAYHIITNNRVSDVKHIVFGYMMAAPLVGLFMSRFMSSHLVWRVVGVVGIIAWGIFGLRNAYLMDRSWSDTGTVSQYLRQNVKPGERLLLNNSWVYVMELYTNGNMATPWDAFDVYSLVQGMDPGDMCEYEWFVEEVGTFRWPEEAVEELNACGTFVVVLEYRDDEVFGLADDTSYTQYGITTRVWRNTQGDSR